MDILVEAMHSVRINGALIVETQLWGEWCYQSQEREALRGDPLTAKSVLAFHLVVEGTCVASIPGQPPVQTRAGELLLLPQAEQHILASSMSAFKTLRPREDHYDSLRSTGGELHLSESASTRFVCGYLSCGGDDAVSAFAKLPNLMRVRGSEHFSKWMHASITHCMVTLAAQSPASTLMAEKLLEIVLLQALRQQFDASDIRSSQSPPLAVKNGPPQRPPALGHGQPSRP